MNAQASVKNIRMRPSHLSEDLAIKIRELW
jgi:hypothetical protein